MAISKKSAITTFYSYKGGVGRSMALANVAWLIAEAYGKSVLVVDWDLEAPGLHRFFELGSERIKRGLIDIFLDYKEVARAEGSSLPEDLVRLEEYLITIEKFESGGMLRLLAAGRQDEKYAAKVNAFDWEEFYEHWHGFGFIEQLGAQMRASADIVLVDSRTGVTDIGGICTLQLPDSVVLLFALNEQNLAGVEYAIQRIIELSPESSHRDEPPTLILRPSRVERTGNQDRKIEWEEKAALRLQSYLSESSGEAIVFMKKRGIPYIGDYSYGEAPLAVQKDPLGELASAFEDLSQSVLAAAGLWEEASSARGERPRQPHTQSPPWLKRIEEATKRKEAWTLSWYGILTVCAFFLITNFAAAIWARTVGAVGLLLASLATILYGVSLVLRPSQRVRRGSGQLEWPMSSRRKKIALLKMLPILSILVIVCLAFWGNYRKFQTFGLPWDLRFRQSQLETLRLEAPITDLGWLSDGLGELTLSQAEISDVSDVPRHLTSLGLRYGAIGFTTSMPNAITRLDLRGTLAFIRHWPDALQELKLSGPVAQSLDSSILSRRVIHLALEDCEAGSLAQLPPSITDLELGCRDLNSLPTVLPDLDSLVLRDTRLTSLKELPRSLRRLVLINNAVLRIDQLPPHLRSLYVESTSSVSGEVLRATNLEELAVDWPLSLEDLPQGITALSVPGFTQSGVRLPRSLQSLKISKLALSSIADWSNLSCLELTFNADGFDVNKLPPSLRVLRAGFDSRQSLEDLPMGLKTLDLIEVGGRRPVTQQNLSFVPRSVTQLDINFLRATRVVMLPPNLTRLSLSGSGDLREIPEPPELPMTLKVLNVRDTGLSTLPHLPDIHELDLAGTRIRNLRNLPDSLLVLHLGLNQVVTPWGLWGLPGSVKKLAFEDRENGGVEDRDWHISVCEQR